MIDFHANNNDDNNNNNNNKTGQTPNDDTKDAEIMVLLKYLSNYWRTLEMPSN